MFFSSHSISIAVLWKKKPYKLSENWENSVRCSHGCSAPSAWQSHKSFISLGCMRVRRCRRSSFEMAPSSTHTQSEYLLCLQTTARWSRLIFLQKAMNKTCIDMHIKSQELTKQNKAKQRCWGSGKGEGERAFSWTCSESLTPPISEGLAQRPSGDAPPPSSWHNCSSWGRAGECTLRRLLQVSQTCASISWTESELSLILSSSRSQP